MGWTRECIYAPNTLPRSNNMQHTHLAEPPHPHPQSPHLRVNITLPNRDRLDSFQSLSLSGPRPSPPSPFFQPLSQSQISPPSSPPSSPSHSRSPNPMMSTAFQHLQTTAPASSHHSSMVSFPGTSFHSNPPPSPGQSSRNVIDLTSSPSPSPVPAPAPLPPAQLPPSLPPPQQFPSLQHTTLESALPKTPVCIGRLDVTALIVYPSPYLDISPSEPSGSEPWGHVRVLYERKPHNVGSEDNISIRTPNKRSPNGEIHPGENFAVVEQRVASVLGPMLGKGLIRVESRIRRGNRHVRVLPSR
jgi:SWI/SNF-related matrix-associated actin-dependent regulator of chromatin subfamily A3